jgi:outer membrane immunogenic protein
MKKFLLGTVGLLAIGMAAPASAADMAPRPYTKAPPPIVAPMYDWSGFYIGGNAGWGESRNCLDATSLAGVDVSDGCVSRSGGLVGGQFGYRWQSAQFVFGVEAQGDWANLSGSHVSLVNPAFTTGVKVDGLGLFTGQIGYAWNNSLLYLKGGAAVTSNRLDVVQIATGADLSASSTRWGGAIGIGWEYGFTPNWSVGIEYDHLFMGNSNNSFSVVNPAAAAFLNDRISQDVDMITVRFNYRFGGYGTPLVARY